MSWLFVSLVFSSSSSLCPILSACMCTLWAFLFIHGGARAYPWHAMNWAVCIRPKRAHVCCVILVFKQWADFALKIDYKHSLSMWMMRNGTGLGGGLCYPAKYFSFIDFNSMVPSDRTRVWRCLLAEKCTRLTHAPDVGKQQDRHIPTEYRPVVIKHTLWINRSLSRAKRGKAVFCAKCYSNLFFFSTHCVLDIIFYFELHYTCCYIQPFVFRFFLRTFFSLLLFEFHWDATDTHFVTLRNFDKSQLAQCNILVMVPSVIENICWLSLWICIDIALFVVVWKVKRI